MVADHDKFDDGANPSRLEDSVARAVARLDSISLRIRFLVSGIPLLTMGTAVFGLVLPAMRYGFPVVISYYDSIFFASVIVFFILLMSVAADILIKRGNVLFEEISDELQWHLDEMVHREKLTAGRRPALSIRITLRNFINSSNLAFYRGSNGLLVYLVINISLWVSGIFVGILTHSLRDYPVLH